MLCMYQTGSNLAHGLRDHSKGDRWRGARVLWVFEKTGSGSAIGRFAEKSRYSSTDTIVTYVTFITPYGDVAGYVF